MKPHVCGRVAVVDGPKFNLPLVIAAHERVLDVLLANAGPVQMAAKMSGSRRIDWPTPGKNVAAQLWNSLKNLHDVDSLAVILIGNGITLHVRLLGSSSIVQNADTGVLKLNDGRPIAELNAAPNITVLGPWDEKHEAFRLLRQKQVDEVTKAVKETLVRFKLDFERFSDTNHQTSPTGLTDHARITFPHRHYGDGMGVISVRCVSSDGNEPDPSSHVEN